MNRTCRRVWAYGMVAVVAAGLSGVAAEPGQMTVGGIGADQEGAGFGDLLLPVSPTDVSTLFLNPR